MQNLQEYDESDSLRALLKSELLKEVFDLLRSGKHICSAELKAYYSLRDNFEHYHLLFQGIGFDLVAHEKGFYYFQADRELTKDGSQMIVFFFVLAEFWSEQDLNLHDAAFSSEGHKIAHLPHMTRPSWKTCMEEVAINSDTDLRSVLKSLERSGFAQPVDEDSFRFLPPAWRLFEMCNDVFEKHPNTDDSTEACEPRPDLQAGNFSEGEEDTVRQIADFATGEMR